MKRHKTQNYYNDKQNKTKQPQKDTNNYKETLTEAFYL